MYVVGITGASGSIIGIRLVEELINNGHKTSVVVSQAAALTMAYEVLDEGAVYCSMKDLLLSRNPSAKVENLAEYGNEDFSAPFASGSFRTEAVVVCPCSMKTLSSIASGYSDNLICRAADTALKETRRCVLVPRETPLNLIHLENMTRAKRAGADIVVPAMGFYSRPQSVDDMVNFITGKILTLIGIDHSLFKKWGD